MIPTVVELALMLLLAMAGPNRGSVTVCETRVAVSPPVEVPRPTILTGRATYYSDFFHGRKTASGARYDRNAYQAAHPSLPFGTRVRVRNLENGRQVEVTILDRKPARGAVIDLSRRAAEDLDFIRRGIVPVEIEILD